MKTRQVTRYSCDFCRKTMYKRRSMESHESGCTNNPERVCRLCARMGEVQADLTVLGENAGAVDILRKVANGCPACMLAGVRAWNKACRDDGETDEKVWIDYKAEHERYWADVNEAEHQYEAPILSGTGVNW